MLSHVAASSYFSREVAREVTQPEWPSRVPRRTSCSAIVIDYEDCAVLLVCAIGVLYCAVYVQLNGSLCCGMGGW